MPQPNILEKVLWLAVRLQRPGNRRKVPSALFTVPADKDLIHVSKRLLDSPELKAIEQLDGEIRKYLYSRCLPSLFKNGVYLLPIGLVEEVEEKLNHDKKRRNELMEKFIQAYPANRKAAEKRLKKLYDPTDYVSEEDIRKSFRCDWQYVSFTVPGKLKEIDKALFRKARERAEKNWAEAAKEAQGLLREQMRELVGRLCERLTPDKKGKPKVFRNTLISNLKDFLDTFHARNITDDKRLEKLVEKAKKILNGVSPEGLREDPTKRDRVWKAFRGIKLPDE